MGRVFCYRLAPLFPIIVQYVLVGAELPMQEEWTDGGSGGLWDLMPVSVTCCQRDAPEQRALCVREAWGSEGQSR